MLELYSLINYSHSLAIGTWMQVKINDSIQWELTDYLEFIIESVFCLTINYKL